MMPHHATMQEKHTLLIHIEVEQGDKQGNASVLHSATSKKP